jgi:hypothetical protein
VPSGYDSTDPLRGEIRHENNIPFPRAAPSPQLPQRAPGRCVEAYYLQRTRFESIAERGLRRRELTEDGNLEINDPTRAGLQEGAETRR